MDSGRKPRIEDMEVLARAVVQDRILITFDKGDFGALIFRRGQPASGIILFRTTAVSASELVTKVVETIQSREDWAGHFSTITDHRVRRRKLP